MCSPKRNQNNIQICCDLCTSYKGKEFEQKSNTITKIESNIFNWHWSTLSTFWTSPNLIMEHINGWQSKAKNVNWKLKRKWHFNQFHLQTGRWCRCQNHALQQKKKSVWCCRSSQFHFWSMKIIEKWKWILDRQWKLPHISDNIKGQQTKWLAWASFECQFRSTIIELITMK